MNNRHGGAIAYSDGSRIGNGLRGDEITRVGRHVGRGTGVEEPLSGLRPRWWNVRRGQGSQEGLLVPEVRRG